MIGSASCNKQAPFPVADNVYTMAANIGGVPWSCSGVYMDTTRGFVITGQSPDSSILTIELRIGFAPTLSKWIQFPFVNIYYKKDTEFFTSNFDSAVVTYYSDSVVVGRFAGIFHDLNNPRNLIAITGGAFAAKRE